MYRFTNTEKWNDTWFYNLPATQKLIFIYLIDNCDNAGFYELNLLKMSRDIGIDEEKIKGALKGLERGILWGISDPSWIFIKNFLRHQKNCPVSPHNKAHKPIIASFHRHHQNFANSVEFEVIKKNYEGENQNILSPFQGAYKGDLSPTGNSIGNSKGIEGGVGETTTRFVKPTVEEVKAEIVEKGYKIDAVQFWNFYESKGWVVGKQKMKSWKSCLVTWSKGTKEEEVEPKPRYSIPRETN